MPSLNNIGLYNLILRVLTGLVFLLFGWLVTSSTAAFDTDEYLHALDAYKLYLPLREFNIPGFFSEFFNQAYYPPLGNLTIAFSFLFFGVSPIAARAPGLMLLLISFWIVCSASKWGSSRTEESRSIDKSKMNDEMIFFLLVGMMSTYYLFLSSTICMLEPFGILLIAFLVRILSGIERPSDFNRVSTVFYLSTIIIALFLTKYSLPLVIVPGLVLGAFSSCQSWQEFGQVLRALTKVGSIVAIALIGWYFFSDTEAFLDYLVRYPERGYAIGLEYLFYYPTQVISSLFLNPILGGVVLIGGWIGAVSCQSALSRISVYSIIATFLIFPLMAERALRFIIILTPFLWVLFAKGALLVSRLGIIRNGQYLKSASIAILLVSWSLKTVDLKRELSDIYEDRGDYQSFAEVYSKYFAENTPSKLIIFDSAQSPLYFYDWIAITQNALLPEEVFSRRQILSQTSWQELKVEFDNSGIIPVLDRLEKDLLVIIPKEKNFSPVFAAYCNSNGCDSQELGKVRYLFIKRLIHKSGGDR
jgi:hypothetical protein